MPPIRNQHPFHEPRVHILTDARNWPACFHIGVTVPNHPIFPGKSHQWRAVS